MNLARGRDRVLRALLVGATAGAIIAGCAPGHGKHTQQFKEDALQRMASLKAATSWDMAQQQYETGDLKKALRSVEDSIALDDRVAKSHVLRGRILIEMDRLETALEAFENAIDVDPENAVAHYYQGIVYERFVRYERALESYVRAAELDETDPQYRLAASEMLIELDRIDEAQEALEEGISTFEHNPGFRQTLGHIAMMRDDPERAMRMFGEACLLAPADEALMEDLARAQIEAARYGDAEYTLRRLIDMRAKVDRRDLKYLRARCLMEIDRPVEARTLLLELTEDDRGGQDARAWIDLGHVSLTLGEDYRLRQCAQRVIALAPTRSDGYMLLAMWQHRAGGTEEAIGTLDRGLRVSDDPGSLAVMQGVLYRDLGRQSEARRAAELALRHDPADARALDLLERLRRSGARVADVPVGE